VSIDVALHFLRMMEAAVAGDHQDFLVGIVMPDGFQIFHKMRTAFRRGLVAGEVSGFPVQASTQDALLVVPMRAHLGLGTADDRPDRQHVRVKMKCGFVLADHDANYTQYSVQSI